MSSSSWKQLTVQAFIQELSDVLSPPKSPEINPQETLIWQKQTVQSFFATLPWTSTPQVLTEEGLDFNLRLSVGQYWQHFQWNAPVNLATPKKIGIPASADSSGSLEDFSSLF